MKILMIAPTPYFSDRGCHVRIYEEAAALTRLGHEVLITTYHLGRVIGNIRVIRVVNIPWYKKTAAGPSWHKLYLDFLLFLLSARALITFRPDIIHAHLHEGAFIGITLGKIFKKPVIFDYQGSLSSESVDHHFVKPSNPLLKVAKWLENKVDRGATFLITSAPRELNVTNSELVADGVDVKSFKPDIVKNRPQTLVYLGLLGEYQGTDLLLEAFKEALIECPLAYLRIGGFPKIEYYQEKVKSLGISGRVEFMGPVPYNQACDFLNSGSIAVAPKVSTTEANQKILSYMACGLPVVAFKTPINEQMLGSGEFLAELGNAHDLALKIKFLLSLNQDQLVAIGRSNRSKAEDVFAWDKVGSRLTVVYDRSQEIYKASELKSSSKLKSLLPKLTISAVLLFLVLRNFDFGEAVAVVGIADLPILALVLGSVILKNVFSSLRWQTLLRVRGPKVPFLELLRLYFIGVFFNNFLPSSVGGDIVKAYKLSKYTNQAFDSSISVFMERFVGILALAFIGALAPIFVFGIYGVLIFITFLTLLVLGMWVVGKFSKVHPLLTKLWGAVTFYKDYPKTLVEAFILSLIIQGFSLSSQLLVFYSLGYSLPIFKALVALPIINIGTFLTLLPNGWGSQEALYSLLFGMLGINHTISVTVSLVYRVLTLTTAVFGGVIYAIER